MNQNHYMAEALTEARAAAARGEIPVGTVIVDSRTGLIIARGGNTTEAAHDPTAHAEMTVLQQACRLKGTPRLTECDLYVTLEPCPMCATAISFARLRRVYFGAYDPRAAASITGPKYFPRPPATTNRKSMAALMSRNARPFKRVF